MGTKGIPVALYHDKHKHMIFVSPEKETESIAGQLVGEQSLTQVGQALEELGITSIAADSPETNGRIERLWHTFSTGQAGERIAAGRRKDAG